jgi:hypothetical protein
MDQTSENEKAYQKKKYDEIIEILLSAGYFRARISTLSEFDKVVGGLCWSITSSGEDVDVDILFQENSTIGQRIALSEAIVKALRKMSCPSPLQPHQIQGGVGGSDYPAIHPVIVWLVKKFFERREERESQLRYFSILQFSKNYEFPSEAKLTDGLSPELSKILSRNVASRTYRSRNLKAATEESRVHACLLEYGESIANSFKSDDKSEVTVSLSALNRQSININIKDHIANSPADSKTSGAVTASGSNTTSSSSSSNSSLASAVANAAASHKSLKLTSDGNLVRIPVSDIGTTSSQSSSEGLSGFEKKFAQVSKESQKEEKLYAEQASIEEAQLLQQMSQVRSDDAALLVSGSQVGAIVSLNSSEIGVAAAAYQQELEESRRQLDATGGLGGLAGGKLGHAAAYKRQRVLLLKQIEEVKQKGMEVQVSLDALTQKLQSAEEERQSILQYNDELRKQLGVLAALEAKASQQVITLNITVCNLNIHVYLTPIRKSYACLRNSSA